MQTPFFGIGAMRAGTSWLSQVLADHPDCGIHPVKEMHFFDVRYNIAGRDFMRHRATQLEKLAHKAGVRLNARMDKFLHQHAKDLAQRRKNKLHPSGENEDDSNIVGMPASPTGHDKYEAVLDDRVGQFYKEIAGFAECITIRDPIAYKEALLHYGNKSAAFGEITPAYALLPRVAFREILSLFPGAKFIFIMRDPIDRLWSQIRYDDGKAQKDGRATKELGTAFLEALSNPQSIGRSNYHVTIETLESEVHPDQILYLFYEKMVDVRTGPDEIRRLEQALGLQAIDLSSDLFETTKNASPKSEISQANIEAAMECFDPVYRFVSERFGLPPGWRSPA